MRTLVRSETGAGSPIAWQDPGSVGLVINPVAGLGGPLAEKGSDRPGIADRAERLGVTSRAVDRARAAVNALLRDGDHPVLAGPGALGEHACAEAVRIDIGTIEGTADDTRRLVAAMQGKVDVILFAGGDGTARDVAAANTGGLPLIGVPAGVKMHSAIFARTPERAGQAAAAFLASTSRRTELVEILDIDEEARRAGRLSARIFTTARTPALPRMRQAAKAAGGGDVVADIDAALAAYVAAMDVGTLYVLGPGTTMSALKDRLGGGTLLGVDVARDGRILSRDVDAATLRALITGPARIVLTVVGGQGFVLGRGNQQITPEIIRAVGPDHIDVICGAAKLAALDPPELQVDTGDAALDVMLAGYRQVITGPGRRQVMRMVN